MTAETGKDKETKMSIPPRIGFIGLGIMGRAMAMNLVKAGFRVSVYNRTRQRTIEFADLGCEVAATPGPWRKCPTP